MMNNPMLARLQALGLIIRLPAVVAYSGGGLLLAAGLAGREYLSGTAGLNMLLLTLSVLLLHGLAAHAVNDWTDWQSGTDRLSPGLLSGGSGVIPRRLLNLLDLVRISAAAVILALILAAVLVYRLGWPVVLFLLVGLWSVAAYSLPPLQLAYRPFTGEWLCAFPALLAVIWGAHWSITGKLTRRLILASLIYSFMAQAWVAEHHLPDIAADLAAQPPKITSPAWVTRRFGLQAARLVPALYAALGLPLVIYSRSLYRRPQIIHAGWPALGSIVLALSAAPDNVQATTAAELLMMALTLVEAGLLIALM
jgi:1,4-dihydroxy-2-naphthoate octaprenyltransferase